MVFATSNNLWFNDVVAIHHWLLNMKDEKNILYKADYVPSHKTDIRKTFAKIKKEQKKAEQVRPAQETQSWNIVQYKKFK